MKKTENIFQYDSKYDSKHILNTNAGRKVPQKILDEIEDGCSLETLEKLLGKNFEIFKYKTQLTIHGEFPRLSTNRIGGYSNLFQNKNKSIGIRWNAIDYEKKSTLFSLLKFSDGWDVEHSSQTFGVYKLERVETSDCEKAKETIAKYRQIADGIDRSLFYGNVECYISRTMWGSPYIVLELNINAFYERNMKALFHNITGRDFDAETARKIECEKAKKTADDAKWEQYEKEAEERRKKAAENKAAKRADFLASNPLPKGYRELSGYAPRKGDEILRLFCKESWDGTDYRFAWVTYKVTVSFGKSILTPIDPKTGKKIGKGSAISKLGKDFYLKVA